MEGGREAGRVGGRDGGMEGWRDGGREGRKVNINLGQATETHVYVYLIRSILLLEILHIRLLYILLVPGGVGTETCSRYFYRLQILLLYTSSRTSILCSNVLWNTPV